MNGTEQLSLKDITFLRAIRDINGSPERYASTDQGVTPATVTAITEATTLSEEEVTYRLDHPRLGRSGLVKVYEAGPPGDDSASLNSAELTEAGERAIAEADDRTDTDDTGRQRDADRAQFDEMQEWEPADVESGDTPTAESTASGGGATATQSGAEPPAAPRATRHGRATASADSSPTEEPAADRLAALESRIEELEAEQSDPEQTDPEQETPAADPERVDDLAAEVASLQESTDRLAARLDDALEELDAIKQSEYGALDEKRERQFETAVKSMVAFHQLATEVLDVRVENYEPAAGRADAERVAITRNRIGDALGVGKQGGGSGGAASDITLDSGDSDWPDPEEAAAGGRTFSKGGDDDVDAADTGDENEAPELESNAPETGVYPPIGGDREERDDAGDEQAADESEAADESDPTDEPAEADLASDAPDTGVYPPIGESREAETDDEPTVDDESDSEVPDSGVYPPIGGNEETEDEPDGSLPASMRPDGDDDAGITETAAEEGHVVDPIRSTEGGAAPRLDIDADRLETVRTAISEARAAADDPYPAGEAYARIVGEAPLGDGATSERSETGAEADPALDDDD